MKRAIKVSIWLLFAGAAGVIYSSYRFSDDVLFPFGATQNVPAPNCENDWLLRYGFANLKNENGAFTCEDALNLPAHESKVVAQNGMRIRYLELSPDTVSDDADVPPAPIWLHVHGATGNYLHGARYAPLADKLGFDLVALELSNHGLSENNGLGMGYGCREQHDVTAVVRNLITRYPQRPILISASSMGTMALTLAAPHIQEIDRRDQVKGLALEAPISSLKDVLVAQAAKKMIPPPLVDLTIAIAKLRSGQDFNACEPIAALSEVTIPILIQQARQDDMVPVAVAQRFAEAIPPKILKGFHIYENGTHSALWNQNPETFQKDLQVFWDVVADGREMAIHKPPISNRSF